MPKNKYGPDTQVKLTLPVEFGGYKDRKKAEELAASYPSDIFRADVVSYVEPTKEIGRADGGLRGLLGRPVIAAAKLLYKVVVNRAGAEPPEGAS